MGRSEQIHARRLKSRFCSVELLQCVGLAGHLLSFPAADENDQTVYLVADNFGKIGRAWRETDYEACDLETIIQDLLTGQYSNPIRVVAFNTAERWSEDVSEDVAHELRRRCDLQVRDIPFYLQDFTDRYEGRYHDVQLPLPMPGLHVVS